MARYPDIENDVELDKAVVFALIAAHGDGLSAKSPDYLMEKWLWVQECRNQTEAISILDVFGQRTFFRWREQWFKKPDAPFASSDSSTTNEGEKQEATLTTRFIRCEEPNHNPNYSAFCYVQDDGSHVQGDICTCGPFVKEECPIDLHRRQAFMGYTGRSGLIA